MKRLFIDRVHRLPRVWSNRELAKFADRFEGKVVNVSAFKDEDKEGRRYRDYFTNATEYAITNYKAEANGLQGVDGEIFLDLVADLPPDLRGQFDVVFNHTTLEHIYEMRKAFANLCSLSNDVVITVLPFVQQYHSHYGDFWRFTPLALKKLYEENGMELVYQSFNSHSAAAVYVFSIGSKNPEKWRDQFDWKFTCLDDRQALAEPFVGCHAIPNRLYRFWLPIKLALLRMIGRKVKVTNHTDVDFDQL
ncbi:MAG: hypothetical protein AAF585_15420 [Verrucomicrobiota bacterium]